MANIEQRLRVAVLIPDSHAPYAGRGDENFVYPGAEVADQAFLDAAEKAGFEVVPYLVHLGNVETTVAALDCDAVFNLCDGTGILDGVPGVEVIEALERRGLPFTGAKAEAYRIGSDKAEMQARFRAAGVPTPGFQVMRSADEPLDPSLRSRAPWIVKPRDAGGSAGIHVRSVVTTEAELRERVAEVVTTYGDALVSEYIDGREVTVAILGSGRSLRAFPPLEVRFGPAFPPGRGMRTFESKWDPSSPHYGGFELLCPAPLSPAEERRVLRVARAAYRAVEGSGYGRVDLRLDARGPFVIEVNPNCSLEWSDERLTDSAMFPICAAAAGVSYPALLRELVIGALGGRRRVHALGRVPSRRLVAEAADAQAA